MSTGDQADFQARLFALLPRSWFDYSSSPMLRATLAAFANVLAVIYSLFAYVRLQMRISTATDGNLDAIAGDFFANKLPRRGGQTDDSYRTLILTNVVRERGTRASITSIIKQLTGRAPLIFEPWRALDTGVYRGPGLGYGVAGRYGSISLPYQAFVTVYRPVGAGIANLAGYRISTGGYGQPSQLAYASTSMINGIQDADIYRAIDSVRVAGTTLWVKILPPPA